MMEEQRTEQRRSRGGQPTLPQRLRAAGEAPPTRQPGSRSYHRRRPPRTFPQPGEGQPSQRRHESHLMKYTRGRLKHTGPPLRSSSPLHNGAETRSCPTQLRGAS